MVDVGQFLTPKNLPSKADNTIVGQKVLLLLCPTSRSTRGCPHAPTRPHGTHRRCCHMPHVDGDGMDFDGMIRNTFQVLVFCVAVCNRGTRVPNGYQVFSLTSLGLNSRCGDKLPGIGVRYMIPYIAVR